jgi:Ca-activated chloride channel family protein
MKAFCVKTNSLVLVLLVPLVALGSPSSALREYKDGKYDQSLKDYQQLLEKKGDDPRLHFNAGAAAYRNRQFDQALKQFDDALNSPDLKLQQSGYYNRGNALFYLGAQAPDPKQRTEAWEKALKDYELSMKLDPKDSDAKFNHEFVKKRLEELKQQQQQQQNQQNKSNDDKQDQQQQQNQQNNQSKQDQQQQQQQQQQQNQQQQNQSPQKQDSSQQKQQQQQQQQANQSQDQKQKQQAQQQQQQQQKQQAKQSAGQKQDKSDDKSAEATAAAGEMTPEEAEQLLDAQKGEEQMLSLKQEGKPADHTRPFKDW